jgi:hypothetical protein
LTRSANNHTVFGEIGGRSCHSITWPSQAIELLVDNTPWAIRDYEGVFHKSPYYRARKEAEHTEDSAQVDASAGSLI